MKKISIIIAVYNIEKYISRCLESVIKQKGNDIEIIIIDDGSTDNSLNICEYYQKKDNRIKIIHQKNKGLNAVRNIGYINSTGQYIWHIDGDDYIDNNSVDILRKYLDKYDIICFNYNKIKNKKIMKIKYDNQYNEISSKYILGTVVVWNKVFKRELFNNNSFPNNFSYNDIYLIPTLINKTNNIVFLNEYLYNYIDRKESLSNKRPFNLEEYLKCLDNVYDALKDKYLDEAKCYYVNKLLVYNYFYEIKDGKKYDYKKLNKILKNKFPKYYKNKYFNQNVYIKIYIRLIYYDIVFLVKFITFFKLNIINKYFENNDSNKVNQN